MPPYQGAKDFYDAGCALGDTKFLTGPALNAVCYEGKADWTKVFVPERANATPGNSILEDLIICRSEEKFLLAEPNRILVDDRLENIRMWEAAGGIGIHHDGDYADTLKRLNEAVKKIEAGERPAPAANKKHADEDTLHPKKPYTFFDIDGVLGDFMGHIRQQGKLTPDGRINHDALDYDWWVSMPAYPGAKEFYDEGSGLGTTKFLTGPALEAACYEGKADWTKVFVPERANSIPGQSILEDLIICRSEEKFLLAEPDRILVDDRLKNIEEWEAAGGIGIHHNGDFADTMKRLRLAIAKVEAGYKPPAPARKQAAAKSRLRLS